MWMWFFHPVVVAVIGAFATAFMHEHTGRDPRTGGLIGAVAGFFGSYYLLVSLWIYLYYNRLNIHVIHRRRRWWEWWKM